MHLSFKLALLMPLALILGITAQSAPADSAADAIKSGDAKMTKGDIERRNLDMEAAMDDIKSAIVDYTSAIDLEPKNATLYYNRGRAKAATNDWPGAVADYNRAITLNPKFAAAYDKRGLVEDANGQQDYAAAIADYNRAIMLNPKLTDAFINRAWFKLIQQDWKGALADYTSAIALDPENATAYYQRSLAKTGSGDWRGAQADYERSLKIDPKFTLSVIEDPDPRPEDIRENRVSFQITLKNVSNHKVAVAATGDDARMTVYEIGDSGTRKQVFPKPNSGPFRVSGEGLVILSPGESHSLRTSIPIDCFTPGNRRYVASVQSFALTDIVTPGGMEIQSAPFAWPFRELTAPDAIQSGDAKAAKYDFDGAIADYNKAIVLDPKLAAAYNGRGLARLERGHPEAGTPEELQRYFDQILPDFDRAIALDPNLTRAYVNRALYKERDEDWKGALADFDQALTLAPGDAWVYYLRSRAREGAGDFKGGHTDYETSLKIDPQLTLTVSVGAPTADDVKYKTIPFLVVVKNVSKHDVTICGSNDYIYLEIYSMEDFGKKLLTPRGFAHSALQFKTLSPGESCSSKSSVQDGRFEKGDGKYCAAIDALSDSNPMIAYRIPIYSAPFAVTVSK